MAPSPRPGADPSRLIELMWRPDTRVGRTGLTLASIVDAAVALADARDLSAVTMRAVAQSAGVGVMTLYGYVTGKDELVDLMVDRMAGVVYAGHRPPREAGGWADALRYIARRNWEHLLDHAWLADVTSDRPLLGPGVSTKYELELEPLDGVGLTDVEMDLALGATLAQVSQSARWQANLERVRRESGLSDEQWWRAYGQVLEAAMVGTELPIARRVGASVASAGDPRATWEFMVDSLVDALHRRIEAGPVGR